MRYFAAIYGFHFTREFLVDDLVFCPVYSDYLEAKNAARSLTDYNITGYVFGSDLSRDRLFDLQAILSFIEHIEVKLSPATALLDDSVTISFDSNISSIPGPRFSGGGAVIATDNFSKESRKNFIELTLKKLSYTDDKSAEKFRTLFFRKIGTFNRQPFLEITYFLLFSGLESFTRAEYNNTTTNASELISKFIKSHGFNIFQENPRELRRSISTYAHIRNALFHEGETSKKKNINGTLIEIKSPDYLFNFSMLVSLVILKIVEFDDGHTNWDCWIDRQLYK